MTVVVNDERITVPDGLTLATLLDHLGYEDAVVAVAVDGAFVARRDHERTSVLEDAHIEIVAPMAGG